MSFLASVTVGCGGAAPGALTPVERQALGDTVLTLFDSVSAIHSGHPDTTLLRRLHPAGDTLLFVEGELVEHFTGDSLYRRVLALHVPVRTMDQQFTERRAHVLSRTMAVLTAREVVHWADTSGAHEWRGVLTLVVERGSLGWVIRAYRG